MVLRVKDGLEGPHTVLAAFSVHRFYEETKAVEIPPAWRGTPSQAGHCHSNDGWWTSHAGPRRMARSHKLSLPRTARGQRWPGKVPWKGAWRGSLCSSRTCQCPAGSWGWQKGLPAWHRNPPGCSRHGGRVLSLFSWRRLACRCSCGYRPSRCPQRLFGTTADSGTWKITRKNELVTHRFSQVFHNLPKGCSSYPYLLYF